MADPAAARWYDDACGTALAMELVGERWSLLIVRELMYGGRRFSALRSGLPGISANVLTQRLESLEASGIVRRRRLPPPAGVQLYELTDWGREADPAIQALSRWAVRSPRHDPTLHMSGASLMMSLRAMFQPERAEGLAGAIGFRVGGEAFRAELADRRFEVIRAEPDEVDLLFEAKVAWPLLAVIYGREPIARWEAQGALRLAGDRTLAERFVTLFPLPPELPG